MNEEYRFVPGASNSRVARVNVVYFDGRSHFLHSSDGISFLPKLQRNMRNNLKLKPRDCLSPSVSLESCVVSRSCPPSTRSHGTRTSKKCTRWHSRKKKLYGRIFDMNKRSMAANPLTFSRVFACRGSGMRRFRLLLSDGKDTSI